MASPKNQENENMTMTAEEFRDALHDLRWTQVKFAEVSGLTRQTVNNFATGKFPPSPAAIAILEAHLEIKKLKDKLKSFDTN